MPGEISESTTEVLRNADPAAAITGAGGDGTFRISLDNYEDALALFLGAVLAYGDLVSGLRALSEAMPPLGDNAVGRAVASRFVYTGISFVEMLRDYGSKLTAAGDAMRQVVVTYVGEENTVTHMLSRVSPAATAASTAVEPAAALSSYAGALDAQAESFDRVRTAEYSDAAEWTSAEKTDWSTYESRQLHAFATEGNSPEQVFRAVGEWLFKAEDLRDASRQFSDGLNRILSTWDGQAANTARGALVPLVRWGDHAVGNADRLRTNLTKAGEAAEQVRNMPGPVDEFDLGAGLGGWLSGSPAALADMQARQEQVNAVKAEQVRYLDQYEVAMAAVYDALPEFDVVPLPDPNDPGPGPGVPGPGAPGPWAPGPDVPRPAAPAADPPGNGADHSRSGAVHETPADLTPTTTASTADTAGPRLAAGLPAPSDAGATRGGVPQAMGAFGPGGGFGGGRGGYGGGANEGRASGQGGGQGGNQGGRGGASGQHRGAPGTERAAPPAADRASRRGTALPAGARGNRQDDEDVEHERASYLVERDPEGTFGTDERTAPPVIG